jgi:hypothetical protein
MKPLSARSREVNGHRPATIPCGWRRLPADSLEDLINAVRQAAATRHLPQSQWRTLDRMRKRLRKLRAAEQRAASSICSICQKGFTGYGHNAHPVNDGRCCDACNASVIVPTRLRQFAHWHAQQGATPGNL